MGFIQVLTDQTMEDVAKSINYTREHLSNLIRKGGDKSIEILLQNKYRKEMEEFFQDRRFVMEENQEEYSGLVVNDPPVKYMKQGTRQLIDIIESQQRTIEALTAKADGSVRHSG